MYFWKWGRCMFCMSSHIHFLCTLRSFCNPIRCIINTSPMKTLSPSTNQSSNWRSMMQISPVKWFSHLIMLSDAEKLLRWHLWWIFSYLSQPSSVGFANHNVVRIRTPCTSFQNLHMSMDLLQSNLSTACWWMMKIYNLHPSTLSCPTLVSFKSTGDFVIYDHMEKS